jgi:hypothetical protein
MGRPDCILLVCENRTQSAFMQNAIPYEQAWLYPVRLCESYTILLIYATCFNLWADLTVSC